MTRRSSSKVPTGDPGGPLLAAIGTGVGAAAGGLGAGWLGYLYAAAFLPNREFAAIPVIVFGGFGGGIAGGALACWLALLAGRRRASGGTALRALAFLFMLAPVLLFVTPALDLERAAGIALGGVAAAIAGAVARLLTPERAAAPADQPPGPRW